MPFEIIRNDISKVTADVIVNTANPEVRVGFGVDQAIYEAAGQEALLAARKTIGPLQPGEAAVTPAFGLSARYIIHTVGPVWEGGGHGEEAAVASCYRKSLALAAELGAESIAFPLIATGTYGFPKDKALRIAISEISSFLFNHDMTVLLVVYDREAFVISGKAFSDIRSYIEEKDVVPLHASQAMIERRREAGQGRRLMNHYVERKGVLDEGTPDAGAPKVEEDVLEASVLGAPSPEAADADWSIEERLGRKGETFQQMLFRIIDRKGLSDPEVYKKANLDRKLFSKIRSNVDYKPSKRTVLALAMALRLNLDETADLLGRAGMALSPSSEFDIIVGYYIDHGIWDIFEVNCALFKFGQQTLGA